MRMDYAAACLFLKARPDAEDDAFRTLAGPGTARDIFCL